MPDTDVIRKNLAINLQDCGDLCRTTWEVMLDSADPGSLGSSRFTTAELKTLNENVVRTQESLKTCQQLLNRRMSPVGNLRVMLDTIINTDPQKMIETDPQTAPTYLQAVESGIATLEQVRQAQQKQS